MGGCASTSNQSTCSSTSNAGASSCLCTRLRRRKRNKRTFADHVINVQQLSSIPNRIFANGKSQSSCIFTQQGRKGINQDAMIVWEDFMTEDMTFCGVFDGHGPHGHLVARKVRDSLPVKLLSFLNQTKLVGSGGGTGDENGLGNVVDLNADDGVMEGKKDEEGSSEISNKRDELWKEAFLKSYKAMDKELKSHPNLDCFCSGSTAVTIIKQGSDLFMGSIGDSRAIMGTKSGDDDSLVAVQLTVDLKPDLPREAERIKQCKGRVFALQDEPEVPRVWLPFVDAPGLAMARAFGDFCLKEYGVICVPEFSHRMLSDKDQFIVLASDGVWDVLSNEEVVEVVSSAPTRSSAARLLVESAAREWKLKYPTSKMDDCAVVCLFLDGKMDSDPSDYEDHGGFSSATIQSTHSGGAAASELDNEQNPAESDQLESESEPTLLERNNTVRTTEESGSFSRFAVEAAAFAKEQEDNVAVEVEEEQKWSGLEGVTRVNSIVQLPRFSSETVKKTSSGS